MEATKEKPRDLKVRTRDFALRVIRLYGSLPKKTEAQVIGRQVLRSGTAVGANYREGLRARSKSEYAAKLNIGLMELEETLYWFELLEHSQIIPGPKLVPLVTETSELSAILVTLIKQARAAEKQKEKQKLESRNQKKPEGNQQAEVLEA
ncbi:MAG: four helix bundle protein [Terriglobia bacterium]|jgi:four helix bundle protein